MNKKIDELDFTKNLLQAFDESGITKSFKKGHYLTMEGDIENNLYFMEDGAVKIYYQSELGEKIIRLGYNGSILNSLSSFFNRDPSELYIEAIRETRVKILKRSDVMNIAEKSQGYSRFLETVLIQQLDREIDLLLDSPSKRLERVLKRSPHLFQHVPLKYIASYLRMSPETLSRIRNS
jgi:CRP-like cAMP-binding protein